MSTTTARPDHRTRPRQKRPPKFRDQAIYLQYLDGGRSQEELAEKHRLTQSRISQIISRVQKWRANLRPQESGELSHEERQRLDYFANREMHESIRRRAIRDYDAAPKQLKISHGSSKQKEKTVKPDQLDILDPS